MVRVCFANFHTEYRYDRLEIRNKQEDILQILSGDKSSSEFCSAWVAGDTVKLKFYTDVTIQYYGFDVVRVEAMFDAKVHARFPGQWADPDTEVRNLLTGELIYSGLVYNWHRYYDPEVRRYITPDPLGLKAGFNVYAYAEGDPINNSDPSGLLVGALINAYSVGTNLYGVYKNGWRDCHGNWNPHAIGLFVDALGMAIPGLAGLGYLVYQRLKRARLMKRAIEALKSLRKGKRGVTGCFVRGTLVLTKEKHKKIEDVEVGDVVVTGVRKKQDNESDSPNKNKKKKMKKQTKQPKKKVNTLRPAMSLP